MTTAEIAIFISLFSACIAAVSLGWNIYRDIVLKAKVHIDFGIRTIIQHGNDERPQYVIITATNHGPGVINLSMVQMKVTSFFKWLFRKAKYAVVMHDYTNPLSGQLPHRLEVGEKIDILFPYDRDCLLHSGCSHVGISDYYGRNHWAKKQQVKEAVEQWQKDFG